MLLLAAGRGDANASLVFGIAEDGFDLLLTSSGSLDTFGLTVSSAPISGDNLSAASGSLVSLPGSGSIDYVFDQFSSPVGMYGTGVGGTGGSLF